MKLISSKEAQAMFDVLTASVIPFLGGIFSVHGKVLDKPSDYDLTVMRLYKKLSSEFSYLEKDAQWCLDKVNEVLEAQK